MSAYETSHNYDIIEQEFDSSVIGDAMTKSKAVRLRKGLNGEAGLLVSMIALAKDDAMGLGSEKHIADARLYFASSWYTHHVTALGLPSDFIPDFKERI